jgi:hypothetical protein
MKEPVKLDTADADGLKKAEGQRIRESRSGDFLVY